MKLVSKEESINKQKLLQLQNVQDLIMQNIQMLFNFLNLPKIKVHFGYDGTYFLYLYLTLSKII